MELVVIKRGQSGNNSAKWTLLYGDKAETGSMPEPLK
jgi:hypothetical protein